MGTAWGKETPPTAITTTITKDNPNSTNNAERTAGGAPARQQEQIISNSCGSMMLKAGPSPQQRHVDDIQHEEECYEEEDDQRNHPLATLLRSGYRVPVELVSAAAPAIPSGGPNPPIPGARRKLMVHGVIGSGGFATVYKATDVERQRSVALKVCNRVMFAAAPPAPANSTAAPAGACGEEQPACGKEEAQQKPKIRDFTRTFEYKMMQAEIGGYKALGCFGSVVSGGDCVQAPRMYDHGFIHVVKSTAPPAVAKGAQRAAASTTSNVHICVAMQTLGPSLLSVLRRSGSDMLPGDWTRYALGMLDALKSVHVKGFVHRDIKPDNFCVRMYEEDPNEVYIIDLGFTKRAPQKPEDMDKAEPFVGTPDYASDHALRDGCQDYVDDLISLGYALLELHLGDLAWDVTARRPAGAWTFKDQAEMVQERAEIWNSLAAKHENNGGIPRWCTQWMVCCGAMQRLQPPDYRALENIIKHARWEYAQPPCMHSTVGGVEHPDEISSYSDDDTAAEEGLDILSALGRDGAQELFAEQDANAPARCRYLRDSAGGEAAPPPAKRPRCTPYARGLPAQLQQEPLPPPSQQQQQLLAAQPGSPPRKGSVPIAWLPAVHARPPPRQPLAHSNQPFAAVLDQSKRQDHTGAGVASCITGVSLRSGADQLDRARAMPPPAAYTRQPHQQPTAQCGTLRPPAQPQQRFCDMESCDENGSCEASEYAEDGEISSRFF